MQMKNIAILHTAVPGTTIYGRISRKTDFVDGGILLLESLEINNYSLVMHSIGVVCESCQKTSHIVVVCRIMGIPVVQVSSVDSIDLSSKFIQIDFLKNQIQHSDKDFAKTSASPCIKYRYPKLMHQLSIVNSCELLKKINSESNDDVEQIFLRSELLWLSLQANPFVYLNKNGLEKTAQTIFEQLCSLYTNLRDGQILNFRGLDLRSDQGLFDEEFHVIEPNPHLGLHGTRQLLSNENYLFAELIAVDLMYSKGYKNVVYSLPFVTSSHEAKSIAQIMSDKCKNKISLGVFIETPAAVCEIESIVMSDIKYIYIGTKDLAQLILGVDRDNSKVSYLMDLTNIPTIKAIDYVLRQGERSNIPVFVFSMPSDISKLLNSLPSIERISIPAADYFQHEEDSCRL